MILNLSEPSSYGIKFKVSKFPDGQQAVTILEEGIQKYDSFRTMREPVTIALDRRYRAVRRLAASWCTGGQPVSPHEDRR